MTIAPTPSSRDTSAASVATTTADTMRPMESATSTLIETEPWRSPVEWWNTGIRCIFEWLRENYTSVVDGEVRAITERYGIAGFYSWPGVQRAGDGCAGSTERQSTSALNQGHSHGERGERCERSSASATSAAACSLTFMLRPWMTGPFSPQDIGDLHGTPHRAARLDDHEGSPHRERTLRGGHPLEKRIEPRGIDQRIAQAYADVVRWETAIGHIVERIDQDASILAQRGCALLSETLHGCASCLRALCISEERDAHATRAHGIATREAACIATRATSIVQAWVQSKAIESVNRAAQCYESLREKVRRDFADAEATALAQRDRFASMWREMHSRYNEFLSAAGLAGADPAAAQAVDAMFWRVGGGGGRDEDGGGGSFGRSRTANDSKRSGGGAIWVQASQASQEDDSDAASETTAADATVAFDADALQLLRCYCQYMGQVARAMLERDAVDDVTASQRGRWRSAHKSERNDREGARQKASSRSGRTFETFETHRPSTTTRTTTTAHTNASDIQSPEACSRQRAEPSPTDRNREDMHDLARALVRLRRKRERYISLLDRLRIKRKERAARLRAVRLRHAHRLRDEEERRRARIARIASRPLAAAAVVVDESTVSVTDRDDDDDSTISFDLGTTTTTATAVATEAFVPETLTPSQRHHLRDGGASRRYAIHHRADAPDLVGTDRKGPAHGRCGATAIRSQPSAKRPQRVARHHDDDDYGRTAEEDQEAEHDRKRIADAAAADERDAQREDRLRQRLAHLEALASGLAAQTVGSGPHGAWMHAIDRMQQALDAARQAWRKADRARTIRDTVVEEETRACLDKLASNIRHAYESDVGCVLAQWNQRQHDIERQRTESLRQSGIERRVAEEWMVTFERKMVYYNDDSACADAIVAVGEFRQAASHLASARDLYLRLIEFSDAYRDLVYVWGLAYRTDYGVCSQTGLHDPPALPSHHATGTDNNVCLLHSK